LQEDIMLRHQGGQHVNAGFYLDLNSWEIHTMSGRQGGVLEGDGSARYLRVPVLGMLLFAPLMGALFAMFLPFIGIYMVARHAAGRASDGLRRVTRSTVMALGPSWQPGAAHLSGGEDAGKKTAPEARSPQAEEKLAELEREIEERTRR
jgi:hypothetical protein